MVVQSEGQRVGLRILGEHKIEHNSIIIALCTALELRATAAYQYSRVVNIIHHLSQVIIIHE